MPLEISFVLLSHTHATQLYFRKLFNLASRSDSVDEEAGAGAPAPPAGGRGGKDGAAADGGGATAPTPTAARGAAVPAVATAGAPTPPGGTPVNCSIKFMQLKVNRAKHLEWRREAHTITTAQTLHSSGDTKHIRW